MGLKGRMLLLYLSLLIGLTSCANTQLVILHPIEKSDIFAISKDTQIGDIKTEKDGYFLSELYLEEVAKAKIEK